AARSWRETRFQRSWPDELAREPEGEGFRTPPRAEFPRRLQLLRFCEPAQDRSQGKTPCGWTRSPLNLLLELEPDRLLRPEPEPDRLRIHLVDPLRRLARHHRVLRLAGVLHHRGCAALEQLRGLGRDRQPP